MCNKSFRYKQQRCNVNGLTCRYFAVVSRCKLTNILEHNTCYVVEVGLGSVNTILSVVASITNPLAPKIFQRNGLIDSNSLCNLSAEFCNTRCNFNNFARRFTLGIEFNTNDTLFMHFLAVRSNEKFTDKVLCGVII